MRSHALLVYGLTSAKIYRYHDYIYIKEVDQNVFVRGAIESHICLRVRLFDRCFHFGRESWSQLDFPWNNIARSLPLTGPRGG